MPRLTKEDRVVRQIIKEYGAQLDLRANPDVFIEIVRKYAVDLAGEDGGLPPGGVGPVGPALPQAPRIDDVLKEIQKLQRQVARLAKKIGE
jgi:hypothetical protein